MRLLRQVGMLRYALAGAVLAAMPGFSEQGVVQAKELASQTVTLDIQPQPISDALSELAQRAGLQIVFYSDISEGITAPRVSGTFTSRAALEKLLEGTRLSYEFINDRTVAIGVKGVDKASVASASRTSAKVDETNRRWVLAQAESQAEGATKADPSSSGSRAAPALEEIVVTAEKRAESVQDLPIAISAFSGETLTNRGAVNLEDLQQLVPSLQIGAKLPDGFQVIAIRGVSTGFGDSTVSVVQDGVPVYGGAVDLDFFDTERVEVLRGPQGTVSGRNATAGAIQVYSRRPTNEFEGDLKFTLGSYDRVATEGYLSGPIAGDRLLGRLAARMDRGGGWLTNELNRGQEIGTVDAMDVRGSLVGKLTDNAEATLIWEHNVDQPNFVNHIMGGRVRPDQPSFDEAHNLTPFDWDKKGPFRRDQLTDVDFQRDRIALRLDWDVGPAAHLAAVTGYIRRGGEYAIDSDGTEFPIVAWGPNHRRTSQVSQEVTLTADLTDRVDVIVGALFLSGDGRDFADLGLPFLGIPENAIEYRRSDDLTAWAGYTQWRYRLTDTLRLTAGVRYTQDSVKVGFGDPITETAKETWSAWTPRFAADYSPSDDLTLYAAVSRGYKSGGFNSTTELFQPEFLWNYEAGLKSSWFDDRVKTRLAGFYMEYQDLQHGLENLNSVGFPTIQTADVTFTGLELELDVLLTDRFRVAAGGTWLPKADYNELHAVDSLYPELGEPGPGGINIRDLSGNRATRAPKNQFNISGQYIQPLSESWQGLLTASYAWQSEIFFTFFNHPSIAQGAFGVLNLSGSLETMDGRWQLTAFANNVTDTYHRTHDTYTFFDRPISLEFIGAPRTYGVSLARRF